MLLAVYSFRLAMHFVLALKLKVEEQLRKSRVVVYNLSLPIYSIICLFYKNSLLIFLLLSLMSNAHKKVFSSIIFFSFLLPTSVYYDGIFDILY